MTKRKYFKEEYAEELLKTQGYACAICGVNLKVSNFQRDHKDGDKSNNSQSNLQLLCPPCNRAKGNKKDKYREDLEWGLDNLKESIKDGREKKLTGPTLERLTSATELVRKISYQLHRLPKTTEYIPKSVEELKDNVEVQKYVGIFLSAWKEGYLAKIKEDKE